jgi:hypothetical protein
MTDHTDRLDRNGQRRGHPAAASHTTLPPLPKQEPLYVITDRGEGAAARQAAQAAREAGGGAIGRNRSVAPTEAETQGRRQARAVSLAYATAAGIMKKEAR